MTVREIAIRPRPGRRPRLVPVPSSSSHSSSAPSRSAASPIRIGWDELRGLDVAVCQRCAESFTSSRAAGVDDWAEVHRCDAEMAALLALVTSGRAA